ncbi:hypothetical protein RF11_12478 [Thelohanellus kitauei]|uniref:Uncharacterized protein n=1 Tax=Thelohanellus kitauei TaxID=669202 RepID=A0A0C2JYL7_THEKT|nr:hypothetical protein RF11_12478 [Thelohanellus kitauei]
MSSDSIDDNFENIYFECSKNECEKYRNFSAVATILLLVSISITLIRVCGQISIHRNGEETKNTKMPVVESLVVLMILITFHTLAKVSFSMRDRDQCIYGVKFCLLKKNRLVVHVKELTSRHSFIYGDAL